MKNKTIIIGIALIVFLILSAVFPAYTLKSYHSDTTTSGKSWTQWPFGFKSNYRYRESALETYLKDNLKEPIEYEWISSRGTRKNIYGNVLVRAHGSPNSLLGYPNDMLAIWIENTPKDDILTFYRTLKNGKDEEVELAITQFVEQSEESMNKHWQIKSGDDNSE